MARGWIGAVLASAMVGSPYTYWPDGPAEAAVAVTLAQVPPERTPARIPLFRTPAAPAQAAKPTQPAQGFQLAQPTQARQALAAFADGAPNWAFVGFGDDNLGLALVPVDPALKKQLRIPDDQGVLVASVTGGGPADLAGLKTNDILLRLADQPVGEPGDLVKHLKAAGEKELTLVLMRNGEKTELKVRPVYRVSLASGSKAPSTEYYLGIQANPLEPTYRRHLQRVGQNQGLVVADVVKDSPAEKAGIEAGDILLALSDRPLADLGTLKAALLATEGKAAKLLLLRNGETETVEVTPEKREVTQTPQEALATSYWINQLQPGLARPMTVWQGQNPLATYPDPVAVQGAPYYTPLQAVNPAAQQQRIDALTAQVQALNDQIEKLKKELERNK